MKGGKVKRIALFCLMLLVLVVSAVAKPATKMTTAPERPTTNRLITNPANGQQSVSELSNASGIRLTTTSQFSWFFNCLFVTAVNGQSGYWVFEEGIVGTRDTTWQRVEGYNSTFNIQEYHPAAGRIIRWKNP